MTTAAMQKDPAENIQRDAERMLAALFRLLQAVRIHQRNNTLVTAGAKALVQALSAFGDEGRLALHSTGNGFYLQGEKLRHRKATANLIEHALAFFERRQLPGLVFTIEPTAMTQTAVLDLASLLNQAAREKEPAIWFEAQLDRQCIDWVEVLSQP